jgi:hypothetical protein
MRRPIRCSAFSPAKGSPASFISVRRRFRRRNARDRNLPISSPGLAREQRARSGERGCVDLVVLVVLGVEVDRGQSVAAGHRHVAAGRARGVDLVDLFDGAGGESQGDHARGEERALEQGTGSNTGALGVQR